VLYNVPLFSNLDVDEISVLAGQVELREFAARQRIFRIGDPSDRAYIVIHGDVRVTVLDGDQQEVLLQEPGQGEFFGFASMLEQTPHMAEATAMSSTTCIEVDRDDLNTLFQQRPHAILDILAFLGRQLHNAHQLARERSMRPTRSSMSRKPSVSVSRTTSPPSEAHGRSFPYSPRS
jgi:CRP-like cAMP-binding protein